MQFLTLKRFKKLNFTIPNLNKFPSISQETLENDNTLHYILKHNDEVILKAIIYNYNYDGWMHTITEICNHSKLIELKLLNPYTRTTYNCDALMVIDSLYHFCNPLKKVYKDLTDRQKNTWRNKFRIRWMKTQSKISGYTFKLFQEYINYIIEKNSFEIPNIDWDNCSSLELSNLDSKVKSYLDRDLQIYSFIQYFGINHAAKCFCPSTCLQELTVVFPRAKSTKIYTSDKEYTLNKLNLELIRVGFYSDVYLDSSKYIYFEGIVWNKEDLDLVECPVCNTKTHRGYIVKDIGCSHCLDKYGKIHSYSTKVPNILNFKAKNVKLKQPPLFLGVELEYESDEESLDAKIAGKLLDKHAILKSDGSVRHGFEIVTCPATLDIHLEEFKPFFEGKTKYTKLYGASNTGMHIHISRQALSRLAVGKMIAFLNYPQNKSFLEKIGGRELNHYCKQDDRSFTYEIYNGKTGARYNILNVNNDATVEIRMFSSPETYEDFASKIEFAECLSKYCSPANFDKPLKEFVNFNNFKVFAMKYKRDYPHFTNVIKGL